jgi:hypothetical protein
MLGERADARAQRRATIESPCQRRILAARHIAELAPLPVHRDRVRVVRIVRLARELEPVADAQLAPHAGCGVMAETGERRVLHEQAHAFLRLKGFAGQEKNRRYSPKASRIHCTLALAPSTRNTSKRHKASGRRAR